MQPPMRQDSMVQRSVMNVAVLFRPTQVPIHSQW
jgi:hypothetical protein